MEGPVSTRCVSLSQFWDAQNGCSSHSLQSPAKMVVMIKLVKVCCKDWGSKESRYKSCIRSGEDYSCLTWKYLLAQTFRKRPWVVEVLTMDGEMEAHDEAESDRSYDLSSLEMNWLQRSHDSY